MLVLFLELNPTIYPQQRSLLSSKDLTPNGRKLHQDFCSFIKYLSRQCCILLKICLLPLHLVFSFQLVMFYILKLMLRTKIHSSILIYFCILMLILSFAKSILFENTFYIAYLNHLLINFYQ